MAKSAIKTGAAAAAAPAAATPAAPASPFAITFGDAPPPAAAFGGGRRDANNPVKTAVLALPAPANGKFAFFDYPVTVADSITDATEREKAISEALKKAIAKVSGVTRRVSKADATAKYTVRSQRGENGSASVRVWRVAVEAPAA